VKLVALQRIFGSLDQEKRAWLDELVDAVDNAAGGARADRACCTDPSHFDEPNEFRVIDAAEIGRWLQSLLVPRI
jgi:hypothetical protein